MGEAPITASRGKGSPLQARFSVPSWWVTSPWSCGRRPLAAVERQGWGGGGSSRSLSREHTGGSGNRWELTAGQPRGLGRTVPEWGPRAQAGSRNLGAGPREVRGPGPSVVPESEGRGVPVRAGAGPEPGAPSPPRGGRGAGEGSGAEGGGRRAWDGALSEAGREAGGGSAAPGAGAGGAQVKEGPPARGGGDAAAARRGCPAAPCGLRPSAGRRAAAGAERGCPGRHAEPPRMSSQRRPAKAQLRRSLSEQLRDSTAKAWDLLWRNVRERRLAGQSPPLPARGSPRGQPGDVPAPAARRGPAPGGLLGGTRSEETPRLRVGQVGEPRQERGRQCPGGSGCGREPGTGRSDPQPLRAAGVSHKQPGSGLSLAVAPCRRHLLSISEIKRVGFASGKQAHLLLWSVF